MCVCLWGTRLSRAALSVLSMWCITASDGGRFWFPPSVTNQQLHRAAVLWSCWAHGIGWWDSEKIIRPNYLWHARFHGSYIASAFPADWIDSFPSITLPARVCLSVCVYVCLSLQVSLSLCSLRVKWRGVDHCSAFLSITCIHFHINKLCSVINRKTDAFFIYLGSWNWEWCHTMKSFGARVCTALIRR